METGEHVPESVVSDKYELTHVIESRSGVLAAYARDSETDNEVFIKVKSAEFNTSAPARLRREANTLDSLSHTQIPNLVEAKLDWEYPYIVTEKKAGTPEVRRWFEDNSDPDFAARICISALDPMEHVHEKQLVHRDIKPGNIVMPWMGAVSLIDFELARHQDEVSFISNKQLILEALSDLPSTEPWETAITPPGSVVGTVAYMSPEQFTGAEVTDRSDIYAMGIVLYKFLYGEDPFIGELDKVARLHCNGEMDMVEPSGRDVPDALKDIVVKATEKKPADRYESAAAMREDLARYLSHTAEPALAMAA